MFKILIITIFYILLYKFLNKIHFRIKYLLRFQYDINFYLFILILVIIYKVYYIMRKLQLNLSFFILLFASLLISCGDEGGGGGGGVTPTPTDPLDAQASLLNGNWKVKDSNSVTKDGTIVDVFTTMTLSISGGTKNGGNYSTSHSEDSGTEVWPNSGSWTFQNGDKYKMLRNDGVAMSISVTETTLRTSFTVSGGLKDGNWVFNFVK